MQPHMAGLCRSHHSEPHVTPSSYFLSTVFDLIVIYICLCVALVSAAVDGAFVKLGHLSH